MGATSGYGLPYADPTSTPDIGYWGQQLADAVNLNLGVRPYTSGTRPAHAPGRLIYETDTGRILMSQGNVWIPQDPGQQLWGSKVQGNYTKTTSSGTDLPFAGDGRRSGYQTGAQHFSDGFLLGIGDWELWYQVSWGPTVGGAVIESEAYITQDIGGTITELSDTHTFAGSGGGRAANQSARAEMTITNANTRFRFRFGSGGGNTFIPPNCCAFGYRRLA